MHQRHWPVVVWTTSANGVGALGLYRPKIIPGIILASQTPGAPTPLAEGIRLPPANGVSALGLYRPKIIPGIILASQKPGAPTPLAEVIRSTPRQWGWCTWSTPTQLYTRPDSCSQELKILPGIVNDVI